MLSLFLYARHAERPSPARLLAGLVAFGAGLLAKPLLVTLPCVLLLLDCWPLGRVGSFAGACPGRFPHVGWRRAVAEKTPFLVLAAGSIAATVLSHPLDAGAGALPLWPRAANALVSLPAYLGKLVWPAGLAVYYPFPQAIPAWQVLAAATGLAAATAAAALTARRSPALLVGWLWLLGTFTPMLGLVRHDRWPAMADRFAYVPMIGLFIGAAFLADSLASTPARRRAAVLAAATAVLALGLVARHQLGFWQDSATLYARALDKAGSSFLVENNAGALLLDAGKYARAEEHFLRALAARPGYGPALVNMGHLHLSRGERDRAEASFRQALSGEARELALQELGSLARQQGDCAAALALFQEALALSPQLLKAGRGKAECLADLGRKSEAADAYAETAAAHLDARRLAEGGELAAAFLALAPDDPRAMRLHARAARISVAAGS